MFLNPLGYEQPSVRTLPANKSLVVADSVYRDVSDRNQTPYNFICRLNGTALTGKEVYYQKLYWNQSIFAHTNNSAELRFQVNGNTATTYVVYATPYLMYTQYDGNPQGTSFLAPQLYSYASNMELALNGDVRSLTGGNMNLINAGSGVLKDANGFTMHPQFRYSPSKGFVFTFAPSVNGLIPVYTLRILPCSWISNAHYVHGFGIVNAASPTEFIPRDLWTVSYFSDDTPTLLPSRYVTIISPELNKDRRMISFQNANSSKFLNELAIFPLNPSYTGAYHTLVAGEDATVISKRDDYNPQSFQIAITDDQGEIIECDDILANLLGSTTVALADKYSFISGALVNRGNANFTNQILFGTATTSPNYVAPVTGLFGSIGNYPFGNPQAKAMPEDLIHEIVSVSKNN